MRCRSCGGRMHNTPIGDDLTLDVCAECGATWFDRSELDTYISRGHPAPNDVSALGTAGLHPDELTDQCPKCLTLSMDTASDDRLKLGRCINCGGVFIGPKHSISAQQRFESFESAVESANRYLVEPWILIWIIEAIEALTYRPKDRPSDEQ